MSDQPSRIGAEGGQKTDPSALTTDALQREVAQVVEKIQQTKELLETQVKAHADINGQKIEALREITNERHAAIEKQFLFFESQRGEQKVDTKQAVVDALAAAKEAVTITATNTKEQIAALQTGFATEIKALSDKLDDVKTQVTDIMSVKKGSVEGRTTLFAVAGFILVLLSIGGILAGVMANSGP